MKRETLGWLSCAALLAVGLWTGAQASANRARGDELNRLQRWCEAQARRNELARTANKRCESELLARRCPRADEPARRARP